MRDLYTGHGCLQSPHQATGVKQTCQHVAWSMVKEEPRSGCRDVGARHAQPLRDRALLTWGELEACRADIARRTCRASPSVCICHKAWCRNLDDAVSPMEWWERRRVALAFRLRTLAEVTCSGDLADLSAVCVVHVGIVMLPVPPARRPAVGPSPPRAREKARLAEGSVWFGTKRGESAPFQKVHGTIQHSTPNEDVRS